MSSPSSSAWNQEIVLRTSPSDDGMVIISTTENSGSVGAPGKATFDGENASSGLSGLKRSRYDLLPPPTTLESFNITTRDVSSTFWKPNPSRGERGLLEFIHLRSAANTSPVLLHTRSSEELSRNFSTPLDEILNLDNSMFKLSRTARAFGDLERLDDNVQMRGREVRDGLMQNLPQLHTDEYFLVKYRDYSSWAVNIYQKEARRDGLLTPKYIEKCFAVKVGQNAGVLIPISEPQLIFGWEIIQKQKIDFPTTTPARNQMGNYAVTAPEALNADQFRSLGVIESASAAGFEQHSTSQQQGESYVAPHPWDWTPAAVQKRWNHFLEQQYKSVGRLVVKTVIIGGLIYFVVYSVRRGLGSSHASSDDDNGSYRGTRRASRRRSGGRQQYYSADKEERPSGGVVGSVVQGLFLGAPKQILDFVLAPSGGSGREM